MVIFEDLRKLLLHQKLKLDFECKLCNKKFYNRIDHLEHTSSCKSDLKCPKCGKTFGHVHILHLHLQLHNLSESSSATQSPDASKSERTNDSIDVALHVNKDECGDVEMSTNNEESNSVLNIGRSAVKKPNTCTKGHNSVMSNTSTSFKIFESGVPKKNTSHKVKERPKQAKKQVGLTKIKMEDCLRCDACSCIYIDEKDYYKHMRNFHQRDMNNTPIKQQKTKKKCRSCCKQCRGSLCRGPVKRPRATQRASNLIFKINMRDNIKNRWSQMVSQQLSECSMPEPCESELISIKPDPDANVTIKQEPELDLSYLLSQVEVKIKTEPPDEC